jgi:ADP-heptose:LPS heptosyltransferase
MARTIVIIHPAGLGDLLLAVPAIRSLRARFPWNQFLLCGQDQASEFLYGSRLVDRSMSVQTTACTALFGGSVPDDPLLKDWLSRCDLAVAWTRDEAGTFAAALKNCGAAAAQVQSPFCSALKGIHQSDRFLETLQEPASNLSMATFLSAPEQLRELGSSSLREAGVPLSQSLVLLHPGSGSRHKCVKPNMLASVIERLREQGLRPLILEGPADREPVANLLSHLAIKPLVLRGPSLGVLAAVLSYVEFYVGHDSGVTHLSALLGIPTVALFGPTDPERWAPRGPQVAVVRGEPCRCPSSEDVRRCTEKPCFRISIEAILTACRTQRGIGINPRNSSSGALSPTTSYVRVAS